MARLSDDSRAPDRIGFGVAFFARRVFRFVAERKLPIDRNAP
jgi:hypothetical protein